MKNLLLLSLSFLFTTILLAQPGKLDYMLETPVTMTINGTSNLHDWEAEVQKVNGTAQFDFGEDGSIIIKNCAAKIEVKSIKSSKGSIMDKKMWTALQADTHPYITYKFKNVKSAANTYNGFTATAIGELTMAGTTRSISIDIKGKKLNNGTIEITGSKDLKMTDFNIDPPTALLGTLTTGDKVTIDFQLQFISN